MDSFGARFSEDKYIKVDIDFESGENEVTMKVNREGTPLTVTGAIAWDEIDGDGGLG